MMNSLLSCFFCFKHSIVNAAPLPHLRNETNSTTISTAVPTMQDLENSEASSAKQDNIQKSSDTKPGNTTTFTFLSEDDVDYDCVKKQFESTIQSKTEIQAIIRLQMSKEITNNFLKYKQKNSIGVVHKMFHGTYYACDINKLNDRELCTTNCGVCGIIQKGLLKELCNARTQQLWFARNACISMNYCRARNTDIFTMFVVDVVDTKFQKDGTVLIIDENEAVLPKFLIIFKVIRN